MNRQTRPNFIYLIALDGRRCFASNHYGECALNWSNGWGWIADSVAREFECDADAVSCEETDDGDLLTVDGKAVAFVAREAAAPVVHLMAAE